MQRLRFRQLSLLLLLACAFASAHAAPRAVIVVGLAAGETQAARLQAQAEALHKGFLARGLTADAITVLGTGSERVRREAILAALAPSPSATAAEVDETWLVLLGSASARGGETAFQISGPRLTASDLAAALKAIPSRKHVVIATTASAGFLPALLALHDVEAVAATAASGEVNEPRFAEAWAASLAATPRAGFHELAAASAARVESFYEAASLAQSEHACLIDRAAGRIIEAPFSLSTPSSASPGSDARPSAPALSMADIDIPQPAGDTELERRPATDETRALLAEARAAAGDDTAHAAVFLRIDADITVGRDFSVLERHRFRAYLRTSEALDDLGTLLLPSEPPFLINRLDGARVITPDGAQLIVNPRTLDLSHAEERREAEDARARGVPSAPFTPPFLPLPEVAAGCIVEAAWTVERRSPAELPEFSHEWSLAERHPVRALQLRVATPVDARWRVFAPNLPAATTAETADTRTTTWLLSDLPALELRAGDFPPRRFAPWVGVSSLASWEAFAAWYRRLATGSAETGPGVEALAGELAQAHPDRASRLRAAYERVAALRYVAIELGVGAFRPRTPEQVWRQRYGDCKDKANLLVALLNRLGIPAEFALVNRFDQTFTDWPAWQFNHALARVPAAPSEGQPHDLWLDTTDRLVPFGIVAPGDLGAQALVIDAGGAAAFHAITAAQEPPSCWREQWTRHENGRAQLVLSAEGSAEVALRRLFLHLSPVRREQRLRSLYPQSGFSILSLTPDDPYDLAKPFVVRAEVRLNGAEPPTSLTVPGLAEFFATETIGRPICRDEGRATQFVHAGDTETWQLPAGPIDPERYAELRARWLALAR